MTVFAIEDSGCYERAKAELLNPDNSVYFKKLMGISDDRRTTGDSSQSDRPDHDEVQLLRD